MTDQRMRASDADRQQAVERLASHYTAGRLDTMEYDERVGRAYSSVFLDDLPVLFADLPENRNRRDSYQVDTEEFATNPAAQGVWGGGGRGAVGARWARFDGVGPFGGRSSRVLAVLAVLAVFFSIGALMHGFVPVPLIVLAVVLFVRRGHGFGQGFGHGRGFGHGHGFGHGRGDEPGRGDEYFADRPWDRRGAQGQAH
jgi:hypothetical protein